MSSSHWSTRGCLPSGEPSKDGQEVILLQFFLMNCSAFHAHKLYGMDIFLHMCDNAVNRLGSIFLIQFKYVGNAGQFL